MFHPKVKAKIKELLGIKQETIESNLIIDKEKEDTLKNILNLTMDGASDDISEMFEHLGHKILIKILVLLTLNFKESKEKEMSLTEALTEFRGFQEIKHYSDNYYKELSIELSMPFIEQIYCADVSIIEYEAGIFNCIIKAAGFEKKDLLEYIIYRSLLSFDNIEALAHINNKGGDSNSFFYLSVNQKIVIKTISCEERATFLKFLPGYSKRIIEHPESKLVRIFGLFQILPHKQDFIIMENAIPNKAGLILFDLKGSTVDRYVGGHDSQNPPCAVVLKDLNFKRYAQKITTTKKNEVIKVLLEDVKVLKESKLMDYSMLVSIKILSSGHTRYSIDDKYSIAIIDFFQRYGLKKSIERV